MDRDAIIDPVPARVRLQRLGHSRDDLERVDVDLRRIGGHRHREQARVRAHVEERVGPSSERGHRVQRQPIVGVRPTAAPPEELLRVLASRGVEQHEIDSAHPAGDLREAGRCGEATRAEGRREPGDEPQDGVRHSEGEEALDEALQAEPALRRAWRSTPPSCQPRARQVSPGSTS